MPANAVARKRRFMSTTFARCPVQASEVPRLNAANESEFGDDSAAVSDRTLLDDGIYPGDVDLWVPQFSLLLSPPCPRPGPHAPLPFSSVPPLPPPL